MQSRSGKATIFDYTCFYRGAKGETGGENFAELTSPVKMLMKRVEKDLSDVAKDPITEKDVRDYIKVEQFKKEHEMKRLEAELNKHKFDNRYRN